MKRLNVQRITSTLILLSSIAYAQGNKPTMVMPSQGGTGKNTSVATGCPSVVNGVWSIGACAESSITQIIAGPGISLDPSTGLGNVTITATGATFSPPTGTGFFHVTAGVADTASTLDGSSLTSLNASQLTSGTLPSGRFPALTGAVTTTTGSVNTVLSNNAVVTAAILNSAVTLAKIANASGSAKLLCSSASGSGSPYVECSLGTNLSMTGSTVNATGGGGGGTPGGSTTQLQYNNAGSFGGDTGATTDGAGNITLVSARGTNTSVNASFEADRATSSDVLPANPSANGVTYTVNGGVATALYPSGQTQILSGTQAYVSITDGSPITWAIANVRLPNATIILNHSTSTRALNLTGLVSGISGVLIVKQDSTGGATMTGGTGCTWKQAGGGGSTFSLTTSANAIDIITFSYDGTNCYATVLANWN